MALWLAAAAIPIASVLDASRTGIPRRSIIIGAPLSVTSATISAVSAEDDVSAALAEMDARKAREAVAKPTVAEQVELPNLNPFDMKRYRQSDAYKKGEAKLSEIESLSVREKLGAGVGAVRKEGLLASTGKEVPIVVPLAIFAGIAAIFLTFERGGPSLVQKDDGAATSTVADAVDAVDAGDAVDAVDGIEDV